MKNNSKILIFLFFCNFLFFQDKILGNEIIFDTSELNITNKGNIIKAGAGSASDKKDDILINAQSFKYDKISSILNASSGFALLSKKSVEITANKFIYNKKLSTIRAVGNVEVNDLTNGIKINTENAFYQIQDKIISSGVKSSFVDKFGNNFITDDFTYKLSDALMKISNAKILDIENNNYYIEKAYLNLLTNKLIGKDISINFNNNNFNKNNDPRLKGKTINADKEKTVVEKGIFTTCKERDDCPPWQFLAKKITHDKKKQTINYENAWLKIYDKPVFYFPKFFHPDPSVKRQSGFLMPSFAGSDLTGTAFTLPYFYAIADNKDLTFSPRFYSINKILAQSEYRAVNAKTEHLVDFSFLNEVNLNSKTHFFSDTSKKLDLNNFDDSKLSLQLRHVSDDTYLKQYKLKSPLINSDASTLTSALSLNTSREDLVIDAEFIVYENLSDVASGDKYEYIYPNYNIRKKLGVDAVTFGDFSLNLNGYIKNYNTNVFEKVMVNDLLFSSYPKYTNKGIKNNYNILFKNVNTDTKNSEEYKENLDTKILTLIEHSSSYPLLKKTDNYTNIIKPIISARYSPNTTSKNIRDDYTKIDANNVFSLNRIGVNDVVEGGGSLSFGTEFYKTDLFNREVFGGKIANVFRIKEDKNLPISSSLGKKTSDIVGNLNYNSNDFFKINYEFSQSENLKDTNYQLIKNEFRVNNFVTTFEYLNENNTDDKESYLSNKTAYNFNETKSLKFETRENKKTKSTEFYNLIYEYRNDCLVAGLEYNRDYYTDRDLKPDETFFFKLTIVPFGEGRIKGPSLK